MLEFFKKLFSSKPTETPAPYKVETPTIQDAPVEGTVTKEAVQKAVKAAKKPAVKAKTVRKPRAPRA